MKRPPNVVTGQRVSGEKLARAVELRRAMTSAEQVLWQHLRARRLRGLHFRRQQLIDGFIADFYCHAAGVVIEVDGPIHQQQPDYDADRDRIIAAHGLRILRITNREVEEDLDSVLQRILTACSEDGS